jgi:hypothetical protein
MFVFSPTGDHVADSDLAAAKELVRHPNGASGVLIQAFDAHVRFTLDGTDPAAGVGFRLTADSDPVYIPVTRSQVLKVIEEAAGATIQYQWGDI